MPKYYSHLVHNFLQHMSDKDAGTTRMINEMKQITNDIQFNSETNRRYVLGKM